MLNHVFFTGKAYYKLNTNAKDVMNAATSPKDNVNIEVQRK